MPSACLTSACTHARDSAARRPDGVRPVLLEETAEAPPTTPAPLAEVAEQRRRLRWLQHAGAPLQILQLWLRYRPPRAVATAFFGRAVQLHDYRVRSVTLPPSEGLPTQARLSYPRYRDAETGRVLGPLLPPELEPATGIHRGVERLAARRLSEGDTLRSVGRQTLLPRRRLKQLLAALAARDRAAAAASPGPEVLGIDGVFPADRRRQKREALLVRCTELGRGLHYVQDLKRFGSQAGPAERLAWLLEVLRALPSPLRLRAITIDGDAALRQAVETALRRLAQEEPAFARVVIAPDRWHAQKSVTDALRGAVAAEKRRLKRGLLPSGLLQPKGLTVADLLRLLVQNRRLLEIRWARLCGEPRRLRDLRRLFRHFPKLRRAYLLRERFCRIFDAPGPEALEARLQRVERLAEGPLAREAGMARAAREAAAQVRRWLPNHRAKGALEAELSRQFARSIKISTGPNEALNRVAKAHARVAPRQSCDTLRDRLHLHQGYLAACRRKAATEARRRCDVPAGGPAISPAAAAAGRRLETPERPGCRTRRGPSVSAPPRSAVAAGPLPAGSGDGCAAGRRPPAPGADPAHSGPASAATPSPRPAGPRSSWRRWRPARSPRRCVSSGS